MKNIKKVFVILLAICYLTNYSFGQSLEIPDAFSLINEKIESFSKKIKSISFKKNYNVVSNYGDSLIDRAKDLKVLVPSSEKSNNDITQIEFIIYFDRILKMTDDYAVETDQNRFNFIPKWAQESFSRVNQKFNNDLSSYLSSSNPKEPILKNDIVRLISAYLNTDKEKIKGSVKTYDIKNLTSKLIENGILNNNNSLYMSKKNAGETLVRAAFYKHERLKFNQNKNLTKKSVNKTSLFSKIFNTNLSSKTLNRLTGSTSLSSQYVWRGMSQGKTGDTAFSGGLDFLINDNTYVGMWGSNVSFVDASYEFDLYSGVTFKLFNKEFDLGLIHYLYPEANTNVDFGEVYLNSNVFNIDLSLNVLAYSKGFNFSDDIYIRAGREFEFPKNIFLNAEVGYYFSEFMIVDDNRADYLLSFTKDQLTFAVTFTDIKSEADSAPKFIISYSLYDF